MNNEIFKNINSQWTLFIDRDGVINEEKYQDYIHTWEEFRFYDGVKEAFKKFNDLFGTIVVITNQRGIAKGLTQPEDLEHIHKNMISEIHSSGGRIDQVYFCGDMNGPDRKPNTGMGLKAIKDFPHIDLSKSIMIGNTLSDMEFGRNLGIAVNLFLTTTHPQISTENPLIDFTFSSLAHAAAAMDHSKFNP